MLAYVLVLICATSLEAQEHAIMLHAQGVSADLHGDAAAALVLLREAHALSPDDADIAFDLARVSLQVRSDTLAQDSADFLRLPPANDDARVLRVYLLALNQDVAGAGAEVNRVLESDPAHAEALVARAMVNGLGATHAHDDTVAARVRLSTEVDSNVELLPQDIPSHLTGWRLAAEGLVRVTPVRGTVNLDVAADARIAAHLTNRSELRPYDMASGTAWASVRWDPAPVKLSFDGVGQVVYAGESSQLFMNDLYGLLELRLPVHNVSVGAYGLAGHRTFGFGNVTGGLNDRTGAHYEGGTLAEFQLGDYNAGLRAGYVAELATGSQQQVMGGKAAVLGRYTHADFSAAVALSYELRDYHLSALGRRDHMLEANARGAYVVGGDVAVFVSYLIIHDASLNTYTYTRHLAELGVEATW